MLNKYYINILVKMYEIAPKNRGILLDSKLEEITIREIIENYQNHPSIIKIKKLFNKN